MRLHGKAKEALEQLMREHRCASKEELLELFQIIVEDDPRVRESLEQNVFDDMIAFDPDRARNVIDLIGNDHFEAIDALKSLLTEMRRQ